MNIDSLTIATLVINLAIFAFILMLEVTSSQGEKYKSGKVKSTTSI